MWYSYCACRIFLMSSAGKVLQVPPGTDFVSTWLQIWIFFFYSDKGFFC